MDSYCYLCLVLFLSYCFVCSLQLCGHLLGKGWPLDSLVGDVFLYLFVNFPYGVLGQMWYLIVLIPVIYLTFITNSFIVLLLMHWTPL